MLSPSAPKVIYTASFKLTFSHAYPVVKSRLHIHKTRISDELMLKDLILKYGSHIYNTKTKHKKQTDKLHLDNIRNATGRTKMLMKNESTLVS